MTVFTKIATEESV